MNEPRSGSGGSGATRFDDRGEIARGGMGTVRAVWDNLLERRVAVKELLRESGPATAEQFVNEARIMGGLDHPNILPVYDLCFDPDGGIPQLLMKLVEGRTLSELLHETAAPAAGARLEQLLGVVLKVCDAMSFAHSRGVVHRDLHPRNVMVGSHGQVFVMDWGLAVPLGRTTGLEPTPPAATFGSGTPAYMAPEQAWGRDDEIDERTDVFGIGGILYEMLTLRPPFSASTFDETLALARRCEVAEPDVLAPESGPPAQLCDIAMRSLARDRRDRYPTVEAVRNDLASFARSGGWFAAQRFPSGTLMLREGDVGDRAYIVSRGTCEVFRTVGARTEIIRVVGPGGVVGEIGLFAGTSRVASVRARTDVTALVVTREALEQEFGRASWMRAFVDAAIERFVELDEVRRGAP
jgi:serine/threonine-protein kinase